MADVHSWFAPARTTSKTRGELWRNGLLTFPRSQPAGPGPPSPRIVLFTLGWFGVFSPYYFDNYASFSHLDESHSLRVQEPYQI